MLEAEEWKYREQKKWQAYEAEKNKLRRMNLSAQEYEAELAKVIERMKL